MPQKHIMDLQKWLISIIFALEQENEHEIFKTNSG